ncbi:hypothetical protein BSKO_05491 [Bryopsis sp. KO-2023]|nr:hypothetical protein BSKO_05491 [Bryopsis sp. KO-2023]
MRNRVSSLESERDELSHRCECLVTSEIKTGGREAAKESKEAAEELDSKVEALSEQLANISIACARDRSDSLMDPFKREIRAKAEMIDELMDDSSAISESFECMEGPKNGLPNMERIVNLWRSTCDAWQLRVSGLEQSVSDLKANKKKGNQGGPAGAGIETGGPSIQKDAELSDGLDRLARPFSFRRESQAKATKEQMQEFEDALQFIADDDKMLKLMLNKYGDSRRIDCKCLMEVCEKQSRDAHRYQEKCCTLEKDLDEVQAVVDHWKSEVNRKESEITKLSEEMDSFSRRSEELGALVAGKTAECAKAIREVEHAHQELKSAKEKNAVLEAASQPANASEYENAKKDNKEVKSQIRSWKEELESSHSNADTLEEKVHGDSGTQSHAESLGGNESGQRCPNISPHRTMPQAGAPPEVKVLQSTGNRIKTLFGATGGQSSVWVELENFIVSDCVTRSKLTATGMADTEKEKGTETGSLEITGVDFVKNTNLNRLTRIYDSTEFLAVTRFVFSRNVGPHCRGGVFESTWHGEGNKLHVKVTLKGRGKDWQHGDALCVHVFGN